jgi:hypothetical protein
VFRNLLFPAGGALVCAYVWVNLGSGAKILGFTWLALGVVYLALLTRGFRAEMRELDI